MKKQMQHRDSIGMMKDMKGAHHLAGKVKVSGPLAKRTEEVQQAPVPPPRPVAAAQSAGALDSNYPQLPEAERLQISEARVDELEQELVKTKLLLANQEFHKAKSAEGAPSKKKRNSIFGLTKKSTLQQAEAHHTKISDMYNSAVADIARMEQESEDRRKELLQERDSAIRGMQEQIESIKLSYRAEAMDEYRDRFLAEQRLRQKLHEEVSVCRLSSFFHFTSSTAYVAVIGSPLPPPLPSLGPCAAGAETH
jgi:hypothetical protein